MTRRARRPDRVYEGRKGQALKRKEGRLNTIGERLRQARLARDPQWTLEDVSQALATSAELELAPGTISKIENGARSVYDYEVTAFALTLGVSANWLLGIADDWGRP